MAYISQERKSQIAVQVKPILQRYGIKGTLAVRDHMTLVLNIREGQIDFIKNFNETVADRPGGFRTGDAAVDHISVNPFWYHEHFSGKAKRFLAEVMAALNDGNHDNSDPQTDYFDVGWYVDINIGKWDRPYQLAA